jgi:hypothetical protein
MKRKRQDFEVSVYTIQNIGALGFYLQKVWCDTPILLYISIYIYIWLSLYVLTNTKKLENHSFFLSAEMNQRQVTTNL